MEKRKDIEYYKGLDYEVVLKKKSGVYTLVIPELCRISEDENLERAYERLETEKEEYFKKMLSTDLDERIKEPERKAGTGLGEIKLFAIKILMVLALFGFGGILTFNFMATRITYEIEEMARGMRNMSDANREKKLVIMREAFDNIRPFINEFKRLWNEPPKDEKGSKPKNTP